MWSDFFFFLPIHIVHYTFSSFSNMDIGCLTFLKGNNNNTSSVHFHFVYNVIYRSKSKESFPLFDIQNKIVREFPFFSLLVHTTHTHTSQATSQTILFFYIYNEESLCIRNVYNVQCMIILYTKSHTDFFCFSLRT